MRKLLLALALALLCFASPAPAQNTQCSDRPSSDSSNACANTRFVQTHPVLPGTITLPSGQIIVGNVSNVGAAVSMSQDCTITNAGVITCLKTNNVSFGPFATQTAPCSIAQGCTGQITATLGYQALAPVPTRAGDIIYWNGSAWTTLAGNNSGTQALTENASGVPAWSVAGSGSVTSVTCGTGLSGGTFTTTGTCALALTNATLQANPANPTGCATGACPLATGVMMGLGTTCKITPVYSTRVHVTFYNGVANSTTGSNNRIKLFFGTGTAPVNGAAATGTQIANQRGLVNAGISFLYTVPNGAIVTGLTPGTAYWFDESAGTDTGTITLSDISCSIDEF